MNDGPLILLSNDDGVQAEGLRALREELERWARVFVVAPESEQSASSHRITLAMPLRHRHVTGDIHAIDGTPADCVYVALNLGGLLPRRPDLVVSGINHGLNLAMDVVYSGTVAAAREGALRGIRSVAISAERGADPIHAAVLCTPLLKRLIEAPTPEGASVLLNVNFPKERPLGMRVTRLGRRDYEDVVEVRTDPRGRSYYWIGGPVASHDDSDGADTTAIDAGYASVTPLSLELTQPGHIGVAAFCLGPDGGVEHD